MSDLPDTHGTAREGFYRHWKNGDVYYVVGVGTLDEHGHGNLSAPRLVTYKSTQSCNQDSLLRHHWEKDFIKEIVREDGTICRRFQRL